MTLIKSYRTFYWTFWRLNVSRDQPWLPEISVRWSDNYRPPCYRTILTFWGCRHKTLRHFDLQDGTECEVCTNCLKKFNYRLTGRDLWLNFRWEQIDKNDRWAVTDIATRISSQERLRKG